MISDQHLIAHGGIGQFCRSFVKMMREQNNQVILITDKKPRKGFVSEVSSDWIVYPNEPISYADHRAKYGRFKDGPNIDKITNFSLALKNASNLFNFDVIVANTHESLAALADYSIDTKKVLYTHLYKQIYPDVKFNDVFLPEYHTFFKKFLFKSDVIVGTQTEYNKTKLLDQGIQNVEVLPIPITETSLLESSDHIKKRGALYIGRWEAGKNPKDYIKIIKQCNLPAKVLTNKNGAKKFEKAFKENDITDYDIRASIVGNEKVEFLKSCKLFLNTSLIESYSNSVAETIGHMPVITLDKIKVPWTMNFEGYLHTINMKNLNIVNEIYDQKIDNSLGLKFINSINDLAYANWAKIAGAQNA